MAETRRLIVTGRVQGVGYRAWTVDAASALGLTGWVRNRRDGSVEIMARGETQALDALSARCRMGPRFAAVDDVISETIDSAEALAPDFVQRPSE